jgi:hypothetical protein
MKKLGIRKAYIQLFKGEFVTEAAFVAYMGCEELQIPIEQFDYSDIGTLDIQKDTIVLGGVTAVRHALTVLGINPPAPLDIPMELLSFTKRDIRIGSIKSFQDENVFPLFVKPTKPKLFTGMVVSSADELGYLAQMDLAAEESTVIVSSVVNFVAEYRVFVIDGKAIDCRMYAGNFEITPDFNFIRECIKSYVSQPIGYAIDFGVTDKGETMLIEVNDGYSIGTYGFNYRDYVRLCILRWNQMVE